MEQSTIDNSTVSQSQRFNQKSIERHFPNLICSDGDTGILSGIVAGPEPVKLAAEELCRYNLTLLNAEEIFKTLVNDSKNEIQLLTSQGKMHFFRQFFRKKAEQSCKLVQIFFLSRMFDVEEHKIFNLPS